MKAFLTIWNSDKENCTKKTVYCNKMIVSDGATIDVDGEKCQLFNVVCSNDTVIHVATIEIL